MEILFALESKLIKSFKPEVISILTFFPSGSVTWPNWYSKVYPSSFTSKSWSLGYSLKKGGKLIA